MCCTAREGLIIECPLNDLFQDARDMIITSQKESARKRKVNKNLFEECIFL